MLDVGLFRRLALALRDDAVLVLLGDRDQLPSVDAGAVLADLVRAAEGGAGAVTLAVLETSHRMRADDPAGGHVVRIWYKPWVTLIWLGAVVMAFAGFLSLTDRRLRVGAPKPARKARGSLQPAE